MQHKIDFLIIGAQKCGTTSLYDYLKQHPDIFLPNAKEIHYFAEDECYRQGEGYLDPLYAAHGAESAVGGAYVHLMYFPHVPARIHAYNPAMRCIAVLRNPIDRAYSAYWFARRNGWETCRTFEEALEREPERQRGRYAEQTELTYVTHGEYFEQLARFVEQFGRDRLLVIRTDALYADPRAAVARTLDFVGIADGLEHIDTSVRSNEAAMPRVPALHRTVLRHDAWYKRSARRVLPMGVRQTLRERVVLPLLQRNLRPFRYPPMHAETRRRLRDHFAEPNRRLSELLGQDFTDWA